MQRLHLSTNKKSITIVMPISAKTEIDVFIVGYDPNSPRTEYFNRKIKVNGPDTIYFQCPQSPKRLAIIAWSSAKGKFKIGPIKVEPLVRNLAILGDRQHDIMFIELFSRRVGRMPPRRTYFHKGASFRIDLLPVIRKDNGKKHSTPARIHVSKPIIQVSKEAFDRMTIPQRVAILFHEYSHNFINRNQDSEMEADSNMVDLYKGLGYGKLEAVYAFANVMSDTDTNYNRLMNIGNKL